MSKLDTKIKVRAKTDNGYYGHRRMKKGYVFMFETKVMRKDPKTGELVDRGVLKDKEGKWILPTWLEAVDPNDPRLSGSQFVEPKLEPISTVEEVETDQAAESEDKEVAIMDEVKIKHPKMPKTDRAPKQLSNKDVI